MFKRLIPGSILVLCSVLLAVPALAQEEAAGDTTAEASAEARSPAIPQVDPDSPSGIFGGKGQLAISSDAGLSISNTSIADVDGSTTTLVLRPAIDYFVIDNLSFGGFLGLDYSSTDGGSSTSFAIGPRVGYNIPFAERFSIWPKAGLSFTSTSITVEGTNIGGIQTEEQSTSNTSLAINLFVPVMFHPVEHFFIGFGPALDTGLSGDAKVTTIAGRLTLGGWL